MHCEIEPLTARLLISLFHLLLNRVHYIFQIFFPAYYRGFLQCFWIVGRMPLSFFLVHRETLITQSFKKSVTRSSCTLLVSKKSITTGEGVMQDCNLSATLFNIYINDIPPECTQRATKDTTIWYFFVNTILVYMLTPVRHSLPKQKIYCNIRNTPNELTKKYIFNIFNNEYRLWQS